MSVTLRDLRIERDAFALEVDAVLEAPCTAIVGASGSGKTSLLEAIAGLVRPARGRIELHGQVVSDAGARRFTPPRHRHVGLVPQEGALFPHLSAGENLRYGSHGQVVLEERRVVDVLGIEDLVDRSVRSLSGGEQRRIALGRALLAGSRLLLLDEPLTALDRALKLRARDLLRRVRDELGVPMILVTHDDEDVADLAREIVRLEVDGNESRIVA